jgi:hypothetical protein
MSPSLSITHIVRKLEDHYLEENILGDFVYLAIDPKQLKKIFRDETSVRSLSEVIGQEWLLMASRNEPAGDAALAIVAFQVALCFNEADAVDGNSDNTLGQQFVNQLEYPNYSRLMAKLFVGTGGNRVGDAFQERLWESVRKFWLDNHGKTLVLPEPRSYRYRYLQFPLSQILMTHRELRKMLPLFAELGIAPEDDIGWQYVRDEIFAQWKNSRAHFNRRMIKFFKEESSDQLVPLYCQLFLRYLQDVFAFNVQSEDREMIKIVQGVRAAQKRLMLEFKYGGKFIFYDYDPQEESYDEVTIKNLENKLRQRDYILFEEIDPVYRQYQEVKSVVAPDRPLAMVYRKDTRFIKQKATRQEYLLQASNLLEISKDVTAIKFTDFADFTCFYQGARFLPRKRINLYARYGLKIGYQTFLEGCGPSIVNDEGQPAKKLKLRKIGFGEVGHHDLLFASPGGYQIRANDTYRSFTISRYEPGSVPEEDFGFDFGRWCYTTESECISSKGLIFTDGRNPAGPVREWINAFLLRERGVDIESLTALNEKL